MDRSIKWWIALAGGCVIVVALVVVGTQVGDPQRPAYADPPAPAAFGAEMMDGPADPQTPQGLPGEESTPTPAAAPEMPAQPTQRAPIVMIDPGHGGSEVGAVHRNYAGAYDVVEKNVNLSIGLRLAALLEADGYAAVMTRNSDDQVNEPPVDRNGDGRLNTRDDLQARVDRANEAKADLFVSIHNNGSSSPWESGTEVWYDPLRPFGEKNLALARLAQSSIIEQVALAGYRSIDRGIKDDTNYRIFNGRAFNLFVLGPARGNSFKRTATEMPGILGESLFVSNDADAAFLRLESIQQGIAEGYRAAISAYFQMYAE